MVGVKSRDTKYTVSDLLGISAPVPSAEPAPAARQGRKGTGPDYLIKYDGVFSDGALEDYRLAKLKVLLDAPNKIIADLEERTSYVMASLDGNRKELTEEVYNWLSTYGLRIAWKQSQVFSSRKLDSILREGEIEDIVENSVLKCLNHVIDYAPKAPFRGWFGKIIHNGLVDLLQAQVNNQNRKRFSEVFPEIAEHAWRSIDSVSKNSGYNFRTYMQDPLVQTVSDEVLERVNQGFRLLNDEQKTALAYAAYEIDYNVAAAAMHKSNGGFRVTVYRARSALATYLSLVGVELPRGYNGIFRESVSRLVNELLEEVKGERHYAGSKKTIRRGRDLNMAAAVFRARHIGDISRSELARTKPGMYARLRETGLLEAVIPEDLRGKRKTEKY